MPLVGFKCPTDTKMFTKNSQHEVDDCLYVCDSPCIPREIIYTIWEQELRNPHKGDYVSVTALLGCVRSFYLERNFPFYVIPRSRWYTLRGSLIHSLTEAKGLRDWLSEFTVAIKVGDHHLSATIDGFQPSRGEISDKKTLKDGGIRYILNGAKEKDVWQVNIYKYMIEHNEDPEKVTPVKSLKIIYLTMSDIIETGKPFVVREPLWYDKDSGYPKLKKGGVIDPEDKRKQLITHDVPPVEILPDGEIKEFIEEKSVEVYKYIFGSTLPPHLSEVDEDMAKWKCCSYYCNVWDMCEELEKGKADD